MSNFYGIVNGAAKTRATRRGHKSIETTAASWKGAIEVTLYRDGDHDKFVVKQIPWHGAGVSQILAEGIVGDTY